MYVLLLMAEDDATCSFSMPSCVLHGVSQTHLHQVHKIEGDRVIMQPTNGDFYKEECYAIQGAVFEVYKTLGCGFLEAVYQESLELEMRARRIPFVAQQELFLNYKGVTLMHTYKPDFICYGAIIVELKTASALVSEHEAQLLNYLKATNLQLGLLVNFGHYPKVEIKRMRR